MNPMPPETEAALEESIAHWQRLSDGTPEPGEGIGAGHCALCRIFIGVPYMCVGCPVMERTGLPCCSGTPYHRAEYAWNRADAGQEFHNAKFLALASKELEFLQSLRPTKQTGQMP